METTVRCFIFGDIFFDISKVNLEKFIRHPRGIFRQRNHPVNSKKYTDQNDVYQAFNITKYYLIDTGMFQAIVDKMYPI